MSKLLFLNSEYDGERILPRTGDIVIVRCVHLIPGKKGFFELQVTVGRCISIRRKGICCSFCLRSVVHKNIIEQFFFLYAPLLMSLRIFKGFYGTYKKTSKLYFFRKKKLYASKFNLDTVMGLK